MGRSRHVVSASEELQREVVEQREQLEEEMRRLTRRAMELQRASEDLAYKRAEAVSLS